MKNSKLFVPDSDEEEEDEETQKYIKSKSKVKLILNYPRKWLILPQKNSSDTDDGIPSDESDGTRKSPRIDLSKLKRKNILHDIQQHAKGIFLIFFLNFFLNYFSIFLN